MSSLRAAASRQAPLFIALIVIALVIAFTRRSKPKAMPEAPAPTATTPSSPEPMPAEPPFGPLRVEDSGLPCEVDDVLAKKCRRCHATPARHSAPFPLFTWDETQALRGDQPLYVHIGRVVQSGYMPIRIEANPPVEPLTDAEKKILLDWVNGGGKAGSCKPSRATKKRVNERTGNASGARPRSSP
jgi:hypothetical protein